MPMIVSKTSETRLADALRAAGMTGRNRAIQTRHGWIIIPAALRYGVLRLNNKAVTS